MITDPLSRRRALQGGTALGAIGVALGLGAGPTTAATLEPTPEAWEGPWYPVDWRTTVGSDLTVVAGQPPPQGRAILFGGIVRDTSGAPIQGIGVQMWHVNICGRYAHPDPQNGARHDPGFRGYGDFLTDAVGAYWFRTIEPHTYSRSGPIVSGDFAPHIHMRLWRGDILLRTVRADFLPRPGAPADTGPHNEPGPGNARWLDATEVSQLKVPPPMKPVDAAAVFDIVLAAS